MNIPQQVLDQARRSPDAVAIEDDQGALTYRVLAQRSLRTAAALMHRFPGPGIIALRLPPGRHHVVAALAAMLAGRPYLSMDPSEPPGRVRRFLEESRICAVVGTAAQDHSHQAVSLSDLLRHCAPAHPREPIPTEPAGAGEGAYVARTSGSTGTPKGVLLGHAGLSNLVSWNNRTYGLGPGCRQLQTAGIGFDAAVWETWPVLCRRRDPGRGTDGDQAFTRGAGRLRAQQIHQSSVRSDAHRGDDRRPRRRRGRAVAHPAHRRGPAASAADSARLAHRQPLRTRRGDGRHHVASRHGPAAGRSSPSAGPSTGCRSPSGERTALTGPYPVYGARSSFPDPGWPWSM